MTTKAEIATWFDTGVSKNATHLIVVCDTFDHDDYPVYAISAQDAIEKYAEYNGKNMQRVMEVYDLSANKFEQIAEHRTHRLPTA